MDLRSLKVKVHMGRTEGLWRVEGPGLVVQKEGFPFQEAGRWGRGVTRLVSQHDSTDTSSTLSPPMPINPYSLQDARVVAVNGWHVFLQSRGVHR